MAGGEAADRKWEGRDVGAFASCGIEAEDGVFGSVVEDVWLGIGDVVTELPVT